MPDMIERTKQRRKEIQKNVSFNQYYCFYILFFAYSLCLLK